mmetsp:Transcript_4975/g.11055  ORF Transcript_4975/g.11055 Transcript_4975/m.11055 type:complete len:561 (-) Transcript_4975:71-1753(-)
MVGKKEDILVPGAEECNTATTNTTTTPQTARNKVSLHLSKELREFYENHNVDLTKLASGADFPYRYIRLNPRYNKIETLNMLHNEVRKFENIEHNTNNCGGDDAGINETANGGEDDDKMKNKFPLQNVTAVQSVPWLESIWGFYALPASFRLSTSPCFQSGRIYGMDVSSGAGVAVLLTDHHDKTSTDLNPFESDDKTTTIKEQTNGLADTKNDKDLDESGEVRVLDLCCSPGLKLLQMADFFHRKKASNSISRDDDDAGDGIDDSQQQKRVKVVGVDISKHRLDVCKTIVNKYFIDSETSGSAERSKASAENVNIQLYHGDGTRFGNTISDSKNLIFDSRVAIEEMLQRGGKRKRMNKSARAREKKKLRQIASFESRSAMKEENDPRNQLDTDDSNSNVNRDTPNGIKDFDYVLVDAECSTDGSFKHIKERMKESSGGHHREENAMLTDPNKLAELVDLQINLIASGFRLLKDGGTLVYSTCSLSRDQNENIVKWLLDTYTDAFLIPVYFPSIQNTKFVTDGSLTGTVRFYPNLLHDANSSVALWGDGFFLAKVGKRVK